MVTVEPGESMDVTGFVGRYLKKGSEGPAELQLNPVKVVKNNQSGVAEIEVRRCRHLFQSPGSTCGESGKWNLHRGEEWSEP